MSELKNEKIKNMYNEQISKKYKNDYEFYRWQRNGRLRLDYYMTYKAIKHHIDKVDFANCFELGPGPGTWTRILYKKNPKASFSLLDISKEMKKQFELEMRSQDNIKYDLGDFLNLQQSKEQDLFFSSRAIEYIDDKNKAIKKIGKLLKTGGQGVIVTKNLDFGFKQNKDIRWQHKDKLTMDKMKSLLENEGLKEIEFYPVIVRTPFLDRIYLSYSEKLFEKIYRSRIEDKHIKFIESYIVKFIK